MDFLTLLIFEPLLGISDADPTIPSPYLVMTLSLELILDTPKAISSQFISYSYSTGPEIYGSKPTRVQGQYMLPLIPGNCDVTSIYPI